MDLRNLPPEMRRMAELVVSRCITDRHFFVTQVLNRTPEDWQEDVLQSLDEGDTRVSIKSGVGVGKTALVSWLAVHFLLFRDDVKVIAVSPSFNQLNDGLIPEVKKTIALLPQWLQDQLLVTSDRVTRYPENSNNFLSFRTARAENPETLQGIHASHVMLLVDEASGVAEAVFDAGAGTMSTRGAITMLIGNPTRVTGLFYRTHTKLKHLWRTFSVTSFDSKRVDPTFVQDMADTYGPDSQQYKIRVLAQFPEGNADSVIPRGWVEAAIGRDVDPLRGRKFWGVDPGRGGDPTGFCEVDGGNQITHLEELHFENLMQTVGVVKTKWDELDEKDRPENIFVDVIGLGAGFADRLEELGLPVVAINVAEVASVSQRFVRLRAELWHKGRLFFEQKACRIHPTIGESLIEKFVEELSETAFKPHSTGKLDVESKRDLKARGLRSPNLADAFLLTMAAEGAMMNGTIGGTAHSKPLKYDYAGIV